MNIGYLASINIKDFPYCQKLKYLTLLENELKSKKFTNQEELAKQIDKSMKLVQEFRDTNSLNNFDVFNYDLNLSYAKHKIDYNEEELDSNENKEELLQIYQRNLIRYEVKYHCFVSKNNSNNKKQL